MKLLNMLSGVKNQARKVFEQDKYHSPIFILNINDQVKILNPESFEESDKKSIAQILVDLAGKNLLKEFIFIAEAWFGLGNEALSHKLNKGSLETFPNKKEAILIFYSSPKKEIYNIANIDRTDEVILKEWEENQETNATKTLSLVNNSIFNNIWNKSNIGNN